MGSTFPGGASAHSWNAERNSQSSALRVQASFGIATTGAGLETADALLGSADQAMYRAKHARKLSRVVSD